MDYKQKAKQLQKDKRALLRQLRSLQRNIREYDQTILNRIIENKNIKLEEYKDKNLKRGDPIYQGIDQSKLVPLLVAAVKELITKVETLEAA